MVYRGDSFLYPFQLPTLQCLVLFNILIVKFLLKVSNLPILLVRNRKSVPKKSISTAVSPLIAKSDIQDSFFNVKVLHGDSLLFLIHSHARNKFLLKMKSSRLHIERHKFTALECHTCLPVISLNIFRRPTGIPYTQRWGIVCSVHGRVVGGLCH